MKAFVGLGNPGEKYQDNRHNVGFMAVDYLVQQAAPFSVWESKPRLRSQIVKTDNVLYAKPQTFMNFSGDAVKKISDFYKIDLGSLYVFYDDLDIRLGEYKIQKGKSPHEHNGILSIRKKLGTLDFWHVRIGIDNRNLSNRSSGQEYVLQDFLDAELVKLEDIFFNIYQDLYEQQ